MSTAPNPHAIPKTPDEKATFAHQVSQGVVKSRIHQRFPPKYSDRFVANDVMRIEIPSTGWLDPETLTFSGTVTLRNLKRSIGMKGCGAALKNHGVQSLFDRVKIIFGSTVVEDIQEANELINLVFECTSDENYRKNYHFTAEGVYGLDDTRLFEKNIYDLSLTRPGLESLDDDYPAIGVDPVPDDPDDFYDGLPRDYNWTLNLSGLLSASKYLPLRYMGSMIIELYMAPNPEAIYSQKIGENPTSRLYHDRVFYELTNVNAEADMCTFDESFEKAAMDTIEKEGLKIHFQSWNHHSRNITSANVSDLQISERSGSVRGLIFCMKNSGDDQIVFIENQYHAHRLEEYQFRIGQEMFPSQPIKVGSTGALSHLELRRFWGQIGVVQSTGTIHSDGYFKIWDEPVTPATKSVSSEVARAHRVAMPHQFMGAMSFLRSPSQLSGYNTVNANADIELKLRFNNKTLAGADFNISQFRPLTASADADVMAEPATDDTPNALVTSEPPKSVRVLFWTYLDSVLNIERIGSVSVSK